MTVLKQFEEDNKEKEKDSKNENTNEKKTESLMFIFYGGRIKDEQISEIKVDGQEILDYQFMTLEEIVGKTTKTLYRRIEKSLEAISAGSLRKNNILSGLVKTSRRCKSDSSSSQC